jgi:AcrR family transcriptional regulator
MPKRRSRAEQTEDNGRRLLDAARGVFVRHGYHVATLDRVAAAAGLTKGAVYARYASKAELFLALLAERITQREREIARLPATKSGRQAVDAMFRQWLDRTRDDQAWALLVLEFRIAAARDRAINARYTELHERVVRTVAQRAAAAGGEPRPPELDRARLGLALANGILLEQLAAPRAIPDALSIAANVALFTALTKETR